VRGGQRYARRERTLPGRFDRRPAAAEIEQQITDAEISPDPTGGREWNDDALLARSRSTAVRRRPSARPITTNIHSDLLSHASASVRSARFSS
jgi:hypothetical protein